MSVADKLTTIAENEQKVYDAGKQAEYDRFWNGYQQNGNRTSYRYAFCGRGWTDETYKPKYPVVCKGNLEQGYRECEMTSLSNVDTSGVTNAGYAFYNTKLKTIDKLDFSSATTTALAVAHSAVLHTIGELVSSETTVWSSNTFEGSRLLANLKITGTIATNFTCTLSSLTYESLRSIIDCLKDYSGTTTTKTLTLGATNQDKLTQADLVEIIAKGWTIA